MASLRNGSSDWHMAVIRLIDRPGAQENRQPFRDRGLQRLLHMRAQSMGFGPVFDEICTKPGGLRRTIGIRSSRIALASISSGSPWKRGRDQARSSKTAAAKSGAGTPGPHRDWKNMCEGSASRRPPRSKFSSFAQTWPSSSGCTQSIITLRSRIFQLPFLFSNTSR